VKSRTSAAIGTSVFFAAAPGVVAGVVPWLLTGWHVGTPNDHWAAVRVLGGLLVAGCATVLVSAFARFAREGLGTPAPVAPTEHLVVGGLYRYVRNPMYLAVVGAIVGQALLLGRLELLVYAALIAASVATFVYAYEQPTLADQFGAEYDDYRRAVPAWLPRRRAWEGNNLTGSTE
jgi:protein-S-isoprenylcysteine O-methyltransferase Ste14